MGRGLLIGDRSKVRYFRKRLLNWYAKHGRSFPWRMHGMTEYTYIIAETLLQRTKAETVAPFYSRFILAYPGWNSLNTADQRQLEEFLKPVGLYKQRSVRLKKLALEMIALQGNLPKNKSDLEKIPFFGQYITNSVLLFIHNKPAPLLDVNMSRLLERFFRKRKLADIRYDPYLQLLASTVVNIKKAKEINWAILDFAALVCRPKPLCSQCPLKGECNAYKKYYSKLYK